MRPIQTLESTLLGTQDKQHFEQSPEIATVQNETGTAQYLAGRDAANSELNKRRPVSPTKPKRNIYKRAGEKLSKAAKASGRESILITGDNTHVPDTVEAAFDEIRRRSDLGP